MKGRGIPGEASDDRPQIIDRDNTTLLDGVRYHPIDSTNIDCVDIIARSAEWSGMDAISLYFSSLT
jgi:hypothetical protein